MREVGSLAQIFIPISWTNLAKPITLIRSITSSSTSAFRGSPLGLDTRNNQIKSKRILKKFKIETILKIPGHIGLESVDVWFQDEARFGQQNTTTRLWAPTGSRPRAVRQQQFEYAYLFGSVCPSRGIGKALVVPWTNKNIMHLHLEQISKATEKGRHAVVVMDGAGWHTDDVADAFDNVSVIKIPPYSPELNPIEQVWSWMRQHCLANQAFKDYDDIVEKVCTAWNRFLESSQRVTIMCSRVWINLIS